MTSPSLHLTTTRDTRELKAFQLCRRDFRISRPQAFSSLKDSHSFLPTEGSSGSLLRRPPFCTCLHSNGKHSLGPTAWRSNLPLWQETHTFPRLSRSRWSPCALVKTLASRRASLAHLSVFQGINWSSTLQERLRGLYLRLPGNLRYVPRAVVSPCPAKDLITPSSSSICAGLSMPRAVTCPLEQYLVCGDHQ